MIERPAAHVACARPSVRRGNGLVIIPRALGKSGIAIEAPTGQLHAPGLTPVLVWSIRAGVQNVMCKCCA